VASAFLTSECEIPNCRAIVEGLTPALKAARTAFSLAVGKEAKRSSTGAWRGCGFALTGTFASIRLGSRPRRSASAVIAASSASISLSSSRFSAPARFLGNRGGGGETRLLGLALLSETACGSGGFAVGRAENRSGVGSTDRRVGMMPTMPPAPHRRNGAAMHPIYYQTHGGILLRAAAASATRELVHDLLSK